MMVPLFHGPEARDRAVAEGERIGRPVSEPVGDDGLSIDTSRKVIIPLASNPGVGDRPPSLVVGPLDKAKSSAAADALLKTIEEISAKPLRLILWADDLRGVIPTIRSRTQSIWCPAGARWIDPLDYKRNEAQALCTAVLSGDPARILGALEDQEKDWFDLMHALVQELGGHLEDHGLLVSRVWERLRPVLRGQGSIIVLADALLPKPERNS